MKPFNLEAALAGAPVVTREGEPVTQLILFNVSDKYPLHGVLNGRIEEWTREGKFNDSQTASGNDLFMAPVKREGWINILRSNYGNFMPGFCIYETREKAEAGRVCSPPLAYVSIAKIEWEE